MKTLQKLFGNASTRKKVLLFVSGLLVTAGWAANFFWASSRLFDAFMLLATLTAGFEIARRAWQGLRNRHTNIELLVTIAATGGLAIEVYWEAAAVTFLFLLGGWLEARTMSKTRDTLKELINMAPETAILVDGEKRTEIPAREVDEGMQVLVKPGAKIPVDGIVDSGGTTVDESAITGEPIPAEKQAGSEVYAGTINKNGRIYVRATKSGADTTLARIIRRVEEAQEEKAPAQRFIERFARWYTPGIVGLSIVSYLFTWDLELALTLLVISCPGALVISTPISVITGIGNAAKKGILIKGGEYLENAGKVTAIALDKTGTLTAGKPNVTEIIHFSKAADLAGVNPKEEFQEIHTVSLPDRNNESLPLEGEELLYWASVAESTSEHPLAEAIIAETGQSGRIPEPDRFESYTGQGIEAVLGEDHIFVGKTEFLKQQGISINDGIEKEIATLTKKGRTAVLVARNNELLGAIGIADQMRPEAPKMISRLRKNGIEHIAMLTGDARDTAEAIAEEVGIREVHAGILPEDKNDIILEMQKQGHQVAMIGDGINDAPALASADIGIAMGAAGTDVAIETADIALMSDKLMNIPEALRLSLKTLGNIRQNVVIALVTVAALLTGVFTGSVHMAGGMLVHELSVLAVILNGMRIRWV
ncbi:Cd2+/Zn2+-exporting ATPase [Fodinibius roseus]|uniref:P-type Zn(2+) transporter n=1 Tax=Fodinibius roseus TaxID=1194090 RepID=A0A1M5G1X4_9BACT|nr:cation-translocating P-type ATPase [Fodinibius roseus]SHF97706.1 Cd2+/Zn2+-exporting ATPase [Fodinibius roseus]